MPPNLALRARVVVHPPKVIAVGHRRERPIQRQDFETMPWQVELPNDFRPKQRNDVGALRKQETRNNLFSNRRPTKHMAPLQSQHLLAGLGEISRIDQDTVPAAKKYYFVCF